jgi:hypothetical protein
VQLIEALAQLVDLLLQIVSHSFNQPLQLAEANIVLLEAFLNSADNTSTCKQLCEGPHVHAGGDIDKNIFRPQSRVTGKSPQFTSPAAIWRSSALRARNGLGRNLGWLASTRSWLNSRSCCHFILPFN